MRVRISSALLLLAFLPAATWVQAQLPYPAKTVRVIVPSAPGGGTGPFAAYRAAELRKWAKLATDTGIRADES